MKWSFLAPMIGCMSALAFPATDASAQGVIDFRTWLRYLDETQWEGDCTDIMADAIAGFTDSSEDQWAWVDQFSVDHDDLDDAIGATIFHGRIPQSVELLRSGHGVLNVSTGQYNIDISSSRVLRTVIEEAYHWHRGPDDYGGSGTHEQLREDIKRCVEGTV
ncbi:MAG: hypothetical protein F4107_06710 [Gemmatimonadetes bacterium]|nr:hypothetical protein [Gemmatimonadota bacterium]MYI65614.1 hypothetical protein [Gemmatimonadota bacterium]